MGRGIVAEGMIVVMVLMGLAGFVVSVLILRWILKINDIIRLLKGIKTEITDLRPILRERGLPEETKPILKERRPNKEINVLPSFAKAPVPNTDLLQERLRILKVRFDELSKKIKKSDSEREKEQLHLERIEIEEEMEKCRLELSQGK
jgi:hypothetical protein